MKKDKLNAEKVAAVSERKQCAMEGLTAWRMGRMNGVVLTFSRMAS